MLGSPWNIQLLYSAPHAWLPQQIVAKMSEIEGGKTEWRNNGPVIYLAAGKEISRRPQSLSLNVLLDKRGKTMRKESLF
jgi:hypothetical protein